jgi:hypothetical protein
MRSCATGAGRACRSPAATSRQGACWDDNPAADLGLQIRCRGAGRRPGFTSHAGADRAHGGGTATLARRLLAVIDEL